MTCKLFDHGEREREKERKAVEKERERVREGGYYINKIGGQWTVFFWACVEVEKGKVNSMQIGKKKKKSKCQGIY